MKSKSPYLLILSLITGFLFLTLGEIAHAQDDQPTGPIYLVQQGDTLSTIALQFGVTVDDLLVANKLGQNDLIFVGQPLIIPGLEGVSGVLETHTIPYGETLRSLSRRYQIPINKLTKLNRLVSPAELYAGSSLILPVDSVEIPQPSRTLLSSGQSLLELAVLTNENPWKLTSFNEANTPSQFIPQDVLFLPDQTLVGPGAFPAPITDIQVSDLYHGETAVITIQAAQDMQFEGELNNRKFSFFPSGDNTFVALQGIHALAEPGLYPLTISGTISNGTSFTHSQMVLINPRGYLFETITVPPALIDPETTNKEEDFLRPFVNQVTPTKLWSGLFLPPSPCPTCINSGFGNRRSYNGSAFTYFHGGVDFPPVSIEITNDADGVVIFAGFLEVRGNFTLIDHGWGVYSAYLHQSEIYVEVGETVKSGQVIGLIGNTGRSTGAHLHWEIWVGGVQVNPLNWLENPYP